MICPFRVGEVVCGDVFYRTGCPIEIEISYEVQREGYVGEQESRTVLLAEELCLVGADEVLIIDPIRLGFTLRTFMCMDEVITWVTDQNRGQSRIKLWGGT